jgi:streptogramin lyase
MALAALLTALSPASAGALVVESFGGLESATNGVAVGPDGNVWAAEQFSSSVVRMNPAGQVIDRYPVGNSPYLVASAPNGTVWVAVGGADKLVWFDATAANPTPHAVDTSGLSACGPVAIASGGDGFMYFSMPSDGGCGASRIGKVSVSGLGATSVATFSGGGSVPRAFGLVVVGGKLFVPNFDGGLVLRVSPGTMAFEAAIDTVGEPTGIAADGAGRVVTTLFSPGAVARFAQSAANGSDAEVLTPAGGALSTPSGLTLGGDGKMYIASSGNASLAALDNAGNFTFTPLPAGSQPWQVASASGGVLWLSDQANTRLLRVSPDPPSAAPVAPPAPASASAPKLTLTAAKKQKLGAFVRVKARCAAAPCRATASGKLLVRSPGAKATKPKLKKAVASLAAGKTKLLKLKLPAKTKVAAAKALAAGGKVNALVTVKAQPAGGGGATTKTVRIRLTR